jgi:hypothetical protein
MSLRVTVRSGETDVVHAPCGRDLSYLSTTYLYSNPWRWLQPVAVTGTLLGLVSPIQLQAPIVRVG